VCNQRRRVVNYWDCSLQTVTILLLQNVHDFFDKCARKIKTYTTDCLSSNAPSTSQDRWDISGRALISLSSHSIWLHLTSFHPNWARSDWSQPRPTGMLRGRSVQTKRDRLRWDEMKSGEMRSMNDPLEDDWLIDRVKV